MSRKGIGIFFLLIIILIFQLPTHAYDESDLWLMEMIINDDLFHTQFIDCLVIEKEVYLSLNQFGQYLGLSILPEANKSRLIISLEEEKIIINTLTKEVQVKGEKQAIEDIYQINGEIFLSKTLLSQFLQATISCNLEDLQILVKGTFDEEGEADVSSTADNTVTEEKKDVSPFTLSNLTYQLTGDWTQKRSYTKADDTVAIVNEDWNTNLIVDLKGTIFDLQYEAGVQGTVEEDQRGDVRVNNFVITYDMDHEIFRLGILTIQPDLYQKIKDTVFYGMEMSSAQSPIVNSSSNIIQITGTAPKGSTVILYKNGWKMDEQLVEEDVYLFKNVVLNQLGSANEIKVRIEEPTGEIREVSRYIAVTEGILSKGTVHYLAQLGKLESKDHYVLNANVNWGATNFTTLGLANYMEINQQFSHLIQNYTSLSWRQRLDDNYSLTGVAYNTYSDVWGLDQSLGYKMNLDYKDLYTQTGIEYHKEGRVTSEESDPPQQQATFYYLQNLNEKDTLEFSYSKSEEIDQPNITEDSYTLGLFLPRKDWHATLTYVNDLYKAETTTRNEYWRSSLTYLINPNMQLIQELGYQKRWNQVISENLDIYLEGLLQVDQNTYSMAYNGSKDLNDGGMTSDYQLAWSHRWDLSKKSYLETGVGFEYQISGENTSQTIPIKLNGKYTLPNDICISLDYEGNWRNFEDREEFEHKLGLSLSGGLNFFGGKIMSTAPDEDLGPVGLISGVVFKDINRNGIFDEGEIPLKNISVQLGKHFVESNTEGEFFFKSIPVGTYSLEFDYNNLPIYLTPSTISKTIHVKANQSVTADLGLYVMGLIDGKIVIQGTDQLMDLSGIKILANPGGYIAYTDLNGYYYLELPEGEYKVIVDQNTLPGWAKKRDLLPKEIIITEKGEYLQNTNFTMEVVPEKVPSQGVENISEIEKVEKTHLGEVETKPEPEPKPEPKPDEITPTVEEKKEFSKNTDVMKENQRMKIEINEEQGYVIVGDESKSKIFIDHDDKIWGSIRYIAETFGASIYWDPELHRIYIVDDKERVLVDIVAGYVMINGEIQDLVDNIYTKDNITYLTLDDLQAIGYTVEIQDYVINIYKEK